MMTKKMKITVVILGITILSMGAIGCTALSQGALGDVGNKKQEEQEEQVVVDEEITLFENEISPVTKENSDISKGAEENLQWYEDGKVYQRDDGSKILLGFLDLETISLEELEIEEVYEDTSGLYKFTIIENKTEAAFSAYFAKEDSNEEYISYIYRIEELQEQIVIKYYFKTNTIQVIDDMPDEFDYNGEYKQ